MERLGTMRSRELFLRGFRLSGLTEAEDYLRQIPTISTLESLTFTSPITFFVGENGSGKSTLLEALAISSGFNPEGGSLNFNFSTWSTHSNLHESLTLIRGALRPKDGFFLRAESFYNVATEIENLDMVRSYGGVSLHQQSHGESFLNLVNHRFWGQGLYLLDEPEAALSPQRQLALLVKLRELAEDGSQFIIATHSPILLAMPGSEIFSFDGGAITEIKYEDTKHFQVTEMMINRRDSLFRNLF